MVRKKKIKDAIILIQELIEHKNGCANYDKSSNGIKSYCCLENNKENSCIYFQSDPDFTRCTYFENSVLPIDNILMAQYYGWLDVKIPDGYIKNVCDKCKIIFLDIKKKEYCTSCAEKVKKEKRKLEGVVSE